MDAKQLGQKIQELRKLKGMTQEDLADKTGLSVRTIQRIEGGEVDPRSYTLNQIAEALGVELNELTQENEIDPNKPSEAEIRKWQAGLHLSGLFVLLVPPIIIWMLKREEMPELDSHAKAVINFQISMWIYLFAASFSIFLFIGIILLPLLGIYSFFITILNTVKVINGESYKYPLSIRFLK
jgi:uncharacterized Tic20 family protein